MRIATECIHPWCDGRIIFEGMPGDKHTKTSGPRSQCSECGAVCEMFIEIELVAEDGEED